jgi:hypothetical protein
MEVVSKHPSLVGTLKKREKQRYGGNSKSSGERFWLLLSFRTWSFAAASFKTFAFIYYGATQVNIISNNNIPSTEESRIVLTSE